MKIKRLGFLLNSLGDDANSLAFLENANTLLAKSSDIEIIAFVQNQGATPKVPLFAVLNVAEAFSYTGTLIATCLDTASKLGSLPGPQQKAYYVCGYEWVHQQTRSYRELRDIFNSNEVALIVNSQALAEDLVRIWGAKPVGLVPTFNFQGFLELLENE